jgi:hypothetical protein
MASTPHVHLATEDLAICHWDNLVMLVWMKHAHWLEQNNSAVSFRPRPPNAKQFLDAAMAGNLRAELPSRASGA